jgi:hypothetical protein
MALTSITNFCNMDKMNSWQHIYYLRAKYLTRELRHHLFREFRTVAYLTIVDI